MSDLDTDGTDPADDQATAEALDDDELGTAEADDDYPDDYPPDRALASEEARVTIDSGDVPPDSLEERAWREEPDRLPPDEGRRVELVEPHADAGLDPDFAAFSVGELTHDPGDDGTSVADGLDYEGDDLPAEELAIHIVDEDGTA